MSGPASGGRLADGRAPLTPTALLARLDALGIVHRTIEHAPVHTVQESKVLRGGLVGAHTKNLFLRNKRGHMWLVACLEDRTVDLKALGRALGTGRLSLGSAERLMRHLGIVPGAVTPFATANDVTGAVRIVLDGALLAHDPLNFHPLNNAMTTAISPQGLLAFLRAVDHEPILLDFDALSREDRTRP